MRREAPAVRLYRHALKVLPARFRRERGDAMVAMLEEEWQERKGLRRGTLLVRALVDLLGTATLERIDGWRPPFGRGPRARWAFSWLDLKLGLRILKG
jgi:hypothetical protein